MRKVYFQLRNSNSEQDIRDDKILTVLSVYPILPNDTECYLLTPAELEERERKAFLAGQCFVNVGPNQSVDEFATFEEWQQSKDYKK